MGTTIFLGGIMLICMFLVALALQHSSKLKFALLQATIIFVFTFIRATMGMYHVPYESNLGSWTGGILMAGVISMILMGTYLHDPPVPIATQED